MTNDSITHAEFKEMLTTIIDEDNAKPSMLLAIPGVFEVLSEYYNNPVIEAINAVRSEATSTFVITPNNGIDVEFDGHLIAQASSEPKDDRKRWTELELYRTVTNRFVCVETGKSIVDGEHDRVTVDARNSEAEVIEFFGYGWLAKRLYAEAGIKATMSV